MIDQIKKLADGFFEDVVAFRRHIHTHPELSFEEKETNAFVRKILDRFGIPHTSGWAGHGVVGVLRGKNSDDKVIALRADMDALPIQEENDVPYKSQNPGVMHACGHDVHTASLLGTLLILNALRDSYAGSVKFVFQPAEERLPGGAIQLIREGVLTNPSPFAMLGQHVHPPLEVGMAGFRAGNFMGSADELFFTIEGRGGHAALPHDCRNPIEMASQLIQSLRQVIARADPIVPTVLSIGKIYSDGGATNIIPSKVIMEGTFRTMDEEWREEAHRLIQKCCRELITSLGGKSTLEIRKGYPVLINDEHLTTRMRLATVGYLGEENVVDLPTRLTAEDFSYYTHEIPSCFYRIGTSNAARGIRLCTHRLLMSTKSACG
jgi:amidohydrolase